MGGFGRSLVRALAGVANGYGVYLQGQGMAQMQSQRDEILSQRQMALAKFTNQLAIDRDTAQSGLRREEYAVQGVTTEAARAAAEAAAVRKEARDQKTWLERNGITERGERAKILLEARLKPENDGMEKVGEITDDVTKTRVYQFKMPDGSIGSWDSAVQVAEKGEDGSLIPGDGKAAPRLRRAPGWINSDGTTSANRFETPASPGAAAPTSPSETTPVSRGAMGTLSMGLDGRNPSADAAPTYTQADAAETARIHGKTVAEVHREMRSRGYKLTGR